VARGRRRLAALLLGLAGLMAAVAVATLAAGRPWPALAATLVAGVPWLAWRMSGDLDPLWLELDDGRLTVQMRRRRERFEVAGAAARRLTGEEIAHLEGLATTAGVVAASGGFDSHRLGEITLTASDLAHAVLIDLGETRLVVTPDDPAAFLAALSPSGREG
jgi:Bacterial PH domain